MHSLCISVVTSVPNEKVFLAEAIKSILRQRLCDFEFLAIDDGPTDRIAEMPAGCTEQIDREDQSHDSRVTKDTLQVTRSHIAG